MKLVEKADVIIENMRAEVKHRLKVSYDDVKVVNPRLVYGSISGFGQTGPYGKRAGVDQIVQGMGGLMSITGLPGQGPVRVGVAIADLTAGNLLAMGVMTALFEREVTGVGRWVYTSLLEAQIFMLDFQASRYLMNGEVAGQAGNDHPTGVPTGVFESSDGLFNIAASSARVWARFCDALGMPDWKEREIWDTQSKRSKDRKAINLAINEITKHKPTEHWVNVMEAAGVPCGPINTIDQVFADSVVQQRNMIVETNHNQYGVARSPGNPMKVDGIRDGVATPAPLPGENTTDILQSILSLNESQIRSLREEGVI
jgi:formyl-CoA transferase